MEREMVSISCLSFWLLLYIIMIYCLVHFSVCINYRRPHLDHMIMMTRGFDSLLFVSGGQLVFERMIGSHEMASWKERVGEREERESLISPFSKELLFTYYRVQQEIACNFNNAIFGDPSLMTIINTRSACRMNALRRGIHFRKNSSSGGK